MPDPDDEFDKIVEHLDLGFPFPADLDESPRERRPDPSTEAEPPDRRWDEDREEELAYRTPPPRSERPPSRARTLAWVTVLGGPGLMVSATLFAIVLPRPVVLALAITFVAAVLYLISQLPEHGPSRPDWPDDGAVL